MNQLLTFIQKEFYHIFRDRITMMIVLGIPVIQIILFGFALTNEVKNTKVVVLAPSNDEVSRRIIERIDASSYFDVTRQVRNYRDIEDAFKTGNAKLAIVFGNEFMDQLKHSGKASVQLLADATDPNAATSFVFYASNIILSVQQEINGAPAAVPMQVTPEVKMLYNPQMLGAYSFVPGVLGMIMILICAMMTSIAIVREKEKGTMEILLASPMKPVYIIIAKITPYFVLSCVNLASVILLAVFVLHVPVAGNVFLLLGVSMLYIILALLLGITISTLTSSQQTAMIISGMGLMMPIMLLSGMIFPVENMPNLLQWLSCLVPARWYIDATRTIMIKGLGFQAIFHDVLALLAMMMVLIIVSMKKFKIRLE